MRIWCSSVMMKVRSWILRDETSVPLVHQMSSCLSWIRILMILSERFYEIAPELFSPGPVFLTFFHVAELVLEFWS